jgi:hypothetical protein
MIALFAMAGKSAMAGKWHSNSVHLQKKSVINMI